MSPLAQAAPTRILVVDDQLGMRVTLQRILLKNGYEVTLASDGEQAFKEAQARTFDVIFMDVKMPGMGGVETIIKIRQSNPKATVIMMTAFAMEEEIHRAIQNGAYCVLNKPFEMSRVLELIEECRDARALVLVVDDEVQQRALMSELLSTHGYRTVTVESGEACMRALSQKSYQAVLLDMNLPGIDGLDVLREIKDIRPEVPVIMISACNDARLIERSLAAGSLAYLRKPFAMDELLELLKGEADV